MVSLSDTKKKQKKKRKILPHPLELEVGNAYQIDNALDPALQRGRAAVDAFQHVLVLGEEGGRRRRRVSSHLAQFRQGAFQSPELRGHLFHLVGEIAPVLQNLEWYANRALVDVDREHFVGLWVLRFSSVSLTFKITEREK